MGVPFFNLQKKLEKCGSKYSYGDVLLIAEFFFIEFGPLEWRCKKFTQHHIYAAERMKHEQFAIEMIKSVVGDELMHRIAMEGAHEAGKPDVPAGDSVGAEILQPQLS